MKNEAAVALGKLSHSRQSEAQSEASRRNGKAGGKPRLLANEQHDGGESNALICSPFRRRTSKCVECPYKDAKPSQRSHDELAYARCTPPEDFHCHMGHERENWSGSYGYGDGETMCRGHWEMYHAAVRRGIEADESAGDRVFVDDFNAVNVNVEASGPTPTSETPN